MEADSEIYDDIQNLKILLNSLTDYPEANVHTNEIESLNLVEHKTIEDLWQELKEIEKLYSELSKTDGQEYYDILALIQKKITDIELEVSKHIDDKELPGFLDKTLMRIGETAKLVLETESTLSEKEKKLKSIKAQYETTLNNAKKSKIRIDTTTTGQVEEIIAKLILEVLKGKRKERIGFILEEEIPELYSHEVLLEIQKQLREKMAQGDEKANKLNEKLREKIVKHRSAKKELTDILYEDDILLEFLDLEGPKSIKQERHEPSTRKAPVEIEETKEERELRALRYAKEFRDYRTRKIKELQDLTGSSKDITPGIGEVTIITPDNKAKKMTFEQFLKKREKGMEIKAIIFGEGIKEIPGITSQWNKMNGLQEIIFNTDLESIGARAFVSQFLIGELRLPPELKKVEEDAFVPFDKSGFIGSFVTRFICPPGLEQKPEIPRRLYSDSKEEDKRYMAYRKYREGVINKYKALTGVEQIVPKREEVTIITNGNVVKKMKYSDFLQYVKNQRRQNEIKAIIFGSFINQIELPYVVDSEDEVSLEEIVFNDDLFSIDGFRNIPNVKNITLPPYLQTIYMRLIWK